MNNNNIRKEKEKEKEKINNFKNSKKNKNLMQYNRLKNINQFINKPNNNNIKYKKVLKSPLSHKGLSKILYKNTFSDLNNIKLVNKQDKNNDSISLNSGSRMGIKNNRRVRSLPNFYKNKSNMKFPNKSTVKNKDKLYKELLKIFGDKIQLYEDTYNIMTDIDKKNCINFLLEAIKELYNINTKIQNKNENLKEMNDSKLKQLKENKKEIKELKKDINKLNKIIKTNIQMNRKLSQNVDNLKLQLEKEKNKNKEFNLRGKSSGKNLSNFRNKNEIIDLNIITTKRNRFKSQDKIRNAKIFINLKKKIEKTNENNNAQKENLININKINIEEIKNNSNENSKENINNLKEEKIIDNNILNKVLISEENSNKDKNNI